MWPPLSMGNPPANPITLTCKWLDLKSSHSWTLQHYHEALRPPASSRCAHTSHSAQRPCSEPPTQPRRSGGPSAHPLKASRHRMESKCPLHQAPPLQLCPLSLCALQPLATGVSCYEASISTCCSSSQEAPSDMSTAPLARCPSPSFPTLLTTFMSTPRSDSSLGLGLAHPVSLAPGTAQANTDTQPCLLNR